jgi:cystathionine beta-lyase/cystathionine gamma-synthase
VLSFEMKGDAAAADAFLRRLRLVVRTVSLGGVETLATRPAAHVARVDVGGGARCRRDPRTA